MPQSDLSGASKLRHEPETIYEFLVRSQRKANTGLKINKGGATVFDLLPIDSVSLKAKKIPVGFNCIVVCFLSLKCS